MQIDAKRIRRAFERSSVSYDSASGLQRDIAHALLDCVEKAVSSPERVLDVGCGTGYFTRLIRQEFVPSRVFAWDVACDALRGTKEARTHRLQAAESENLAYKSEYFDLVCSNACYQWSWDLSKSMEEAYRVLKPGGSFCFSIFGANTFYELRDSIETACSNGIFIKPASGDFIGLEELKALFSPAGFCDIEVKGYEAQRLYPGLFEFLKTLKKTGVNLSVVSGIKSLGWRRVLNSIETVYRERFSDNGYIPATYEVFIAKAKKPQ